jgi:nucleoid-associated protein YgaU
VEAGETLEKVAFRVYGTTAAVEHLWQSNRDLLPQRGSDLAVGLPLRTP